LSKELRRAHRALEPYPEPLAKQIAHDLDLVLTRLQEAGHFPPSETIFSFPQEEDDSDENDEVVKIEP
jgi:hypothetical protein